MGWLRKAELLKDVDRKGAVAELRELSRLGLDIFAKAALGMGDRNRAGPGSSRSGYDKKPATPFSFLVNNFSMIRIRFTLA